MRRKQKKLARARASYSAMHLALASTTQPMRKDLRDRQLQIMRDGLEKLCAGVDATKDDWWPVSDAVNLLETFVLNGWVEDGIEAGDGFHADAERALAEAGTRAMAGEPLRLDEAGAEACQAVLLAYEAVIRQISERNLMEAINATERRVREVLAAKGRKGDLLVTVPQ